LYLFSTVGADINSCLNCIENIRALVYNGRPPQIDFPQRILQ